ncbi:AAA family ATPase [Saccharopolyspora sp. 6M]|uniref:AAA family ATPase n=1 Tax=Saccharopolyspora sp. 6M TaxID=2877237 RepID=UPI001CD6D932|nr:AAA family ATPase [Saccharopolyspora sp. 6M]MCA1229397.1 AAA family ATPase [Saccharopolyspora sp. 6M]
MAHAEHRAALRILYGIPCAGKSTAAISVATHHGLRTVIGTDYLREVQRLLTPPQQAPALRMVTHTAWQRHGPPTRDNIATGFREHVAAVAPAIHAVVAKLARDGFDAVLEGAHFHGDLIGELRTAYPELALHATVLAVGSADELRQRIAAKERTRAATSERKAWAEHVPVLMMLQDLLHADARSHGIPVTTSEGLLTCSPHNPCC